jgi:flagellar assembly protein FliH
VAVVRKFTFDNDFDRPARPAAKPEPVKVEEAPPPPPAPTFSEEEMAAAVAEARKAARAEGLAEGLAKGKADAAAAAEKQIAGGLNAIAQHFAAIAREAEQCSSAVSTTAVEVALAMTRRLFPELARRHGLGEIEGLLERALDMLKTEPRFTVRLAAEQRDALVERIDALASQRGFEGRIVVTGEAEMKLGDCRIEWSQGGLIRSADEIWSGIEAAMAQALAPAAAAGVTTEAAASGPAAD